MPAKAVIIDRAEKKRLLRLPLHVHIRMIRALEAIQENPIIGIKLHGELEKNYKYRVGDYRIVYSFDSKRSVVNVVKIEHRQGVYK